MPHYARGQTKRLPQRGGQNAVRPDTLIPRPRLSTKPGQAQTNVCAMRLRGVNRLHHWTVLAIFHNAPIRWPSALDRMMRSIGDLLAIRAVGPLVYAKPRAEGARERSQRRDVALGSDGRVAVGQRNADQTETV